MEVSGLMRTGKLAMERQGIPLVVPSLIPGRYDDADDGVDRCMMVSDRYYLAVLSLL